MLNDYADRSTLYIYCDGPKEGALKEELSKINQIRTLVRKKKWCNEVHIIEHKTNQGLANNILTGVTAIIKKYGKIIVLEDDIITSKFFLKYMNYSLNYYQNDKKVFHINGYNNQSNLQFILDDYYFLRFMFCWGWGTWEDRWNKIDKDYNTCYKKLVNSKELLYKFNYGNIMKFQEQLTDNINIKENTWAILWNCSIFFNDGYCLTSKSSYVTNIGMDGTGANCKKTDIYDGNLSKNIKLFKGNIKILEKYKSRLHLKLFFEFGNKFKLHRFLIRSLKKVFKS